MNKINTNKTNIFLSLALLLSAATGKVAFCMQQKDSVKIWENQIANSLDQESTTNPVKNGLISEEDRIREFEKEEQRRRNSFGEIDQNVLKDIIFEYLKLNDLNKISESCNILNELFNDYMKDSVKDSKKKINLTINLLNFSTDISNIMKIQEKMFEFINGTDRVLTINYSYRTITTTKTINKTNVKELRSQEILLNTKLSLEERYNSYKKAAEINTTINYNMTMAHFAFA